MADCLDNPRHAHDEFPNVGRSPRFDLNNASTREVLAERNHRGPRRTGDEGRQAHYDLCGGDQCPCYREGQAHERQWHSDRWQSLAGDLWNQLLSVPEEHLHPDAQDFIQTYEEMVGLR